MKWNSGNPLHFYSEDTGMIWASVINIDTRYTAYRNFGGLGDSPVQFISSEKAKQWIESEWVKYLDAVEPASETKQGSVFTTDEIRYLLSLVQIHNTKASAAGLSLHSTAVELEKKLTALVKESKRDLPGDSKP